MIKRLKIKDLRLKNFKIINHSSSIIIRKSGGFTLVELLISIAIISVLTSLIMANFIGIRQRARDAQRKSDVRQIQSALELYRADQGSYPASLPGCKNQFTSPNGSVVYMKNIPCDPLHPNYYYGGNYFYSSTSGCDSGFTPQTGYHVQVCLENKNDSEGRSESFGGCPTQYFLCTDNP